MKMKILALCAVLVMACSAMHFVEPVAAVKMVDHGTKYFTSAHPKDVKYVWKTYQYNNNYLKIYLTGYYKSKGKYIVGNHLVATITKAKKSTVKIGEYDRLRSGYIHKSKYYDITSLTAARYYWRVYKQTLFYN